MRELIEAARAELLYLPPYSPDFNPMEKAWAKLKQRLRALKARSLDLLQQAIAQAMENALEGGLCNEMQSHLL